MIKADVKGIKELERTLKKMTGREANNAVAAGLRAGGRVIVKDARSRLPSEYDILKKSLTVKIKRRSSPYVLDGSIGPTVGSNAKFNGWYAHFIEFGVDPHEIKPKRSKLMNIGDDRWSTKVSHPGIKKIPFLRPAAENNMPQVQRAYIDKVWTAIKKVLR